MRRKRVAIVGAGPAGAYAAGQLRASRARPDVDIFERLPTPWGLLRGGVAPDHQEIKALAHTFTAEVIDRGCRFFGNVELGRDIGHNDLMRHYHAVIYAVGARSDKSLGIPGEDLPGSLPATDFVGWYNRHPDLRDLVPDLSVKRAVIIGNGNVAADVARILTRSVAELERTDLADHALAALRESAIEEVVVLGRRGPAQAAFTSAELRELGHMDGVDLYVRPEEAALDVVSAEWLEQEGTFTARRNVKLLREFAQQGPKLGATRRIELRFLRSPIAIHGAGRVESIEVARNELYRDERGAIRARTTDATETIECGLVLRSVGYRAVPLPDVPFDERNFILPNERGRVMDPITGRVVPGVYAVGWIKRGPTGILGTNKRDAQETVDRLLEDIDSLPDPPDRSDLSLPGAISFEGWQAIDAAETAAGEAQHRPRVKLTTVDELLAAARY
jgi:ferredoxin/flavodoxin---NADP+ reductase